MQSEPFFSLRRVVADQLVSQSIKVAAADVERRGLVERQQLGRDGDEAGWPRCVVVREVRRGAAATWRPPRCPERVS